MYWLAKKAYISEERKKKSWPAWKAEEDEELNTLYQEHLLNSLSTYAVENDTHF